MLSCSNQGFPAKALSPFVRLYLEYCVQWSPLHKKNTWTGWRRARKATEMIQHREAVMWGKAEGPGLGEPWEGRLEVLGTGSQGWEGGYRGDGDSARSHMEKTRGNGDKLPLGRAQLDTRGQWFTVRTMSHWNNLPREWWNPQHRAELGWKGFWAILSRLSFGQGALGQTILQFPSSLVFCDSLKLSSLQPKLAKFWGLTSQAGEKICSTVLTER